MSATETAPTIRNAGTKPTTPRKLFVNIPVSDLQRSIDFFETLGFAFNTAEKFRGFTKRPTGDAQKETSVLFAITVNSRDEVDTLVEKALAAGGSLATDPQDHGFMYVHSFYDLDGHHWEAFWMDPSAVQG